MIEPWKLGGRLGNWMFQYAFMYTYAKEHGTDIYFQDPKYFEKYANEIKAIFGDLTWIGEPMNEYVSIHVRRGDYVGNTFYTDLMQTDYYPLAMGEFPERKFLVFSDDIEWCKQQAIFKDCEFSEGRGELDDLNLMLHCNGHIVSNSTFAFWGAYLGKGLTICPDESKYYGDGVKRTVFPSFWTRI